jgi:hypothetical protein
MKRNAIIKVEKTLTKVTVVVVGFEPMELTPMQLSADCHAAATIHGITQKLVDAAAISRNTETGKPATAADKYAAIKEVYDRLVAGGPWNAEREGGTSGGILFAALCRLYDGKRTAEQVREFLAGKTDAEKTALRGNPKVADVVRAIEAERAEKTGVDSDEQLTQLLEYAEERTVIGARQK